MTIILLLPAYFYPRSPCGERLRGISSGRAETAISIHALLAESDKLVKTDTSEHLISIHALLAESDKIPYQRQIDQKNFYPRSPCGERRGIFTAFCVDCLFLSTLSLRRATGFFYAFDFELRNFYPRSPCGERQCSSLLSQQRIEYFYPRSPCGERHFLIFSISIDLYFYPRSPCGERHQA